MIVANIKGGLGNQMFQYALGRRLALKNNDVLLLDVSGLDAARKSGDTYRPYALGAFNIQGAIADVRESRRLRYPLGMLSYAAEKFKTKILRQLHTGFEPAVLEKKGDVYLDGYWQSPKYFEGIRKTLLRDFTLRDPLLPQAADIAKAMQSPDSVSLHVRRGDYVSNKKVATSYGPCTPAYYERALDEIRRHIVKPSWFVFSDDIAWVKANLPLPEDTVFVSAKGLKDAEELWLMSRCRHNIVANSSFSWWGAWLNQNPEKIVIAPTPWFDYDPPFDNDIIPDSWIQIQKR